VVPKLATIVLAAGESRRMGEPKLFLPVGKTTLLRGAVSSAMDLGHPVVVVTGAYDKDIREHLKDWAGLTLVHNPDWANGMTSSISAGVQAATTFKPDFFFITLADQPSMMAESLAFLVDELFRNEDKVIATEYPERMGVPAIFPARLTADLLGLNGKFGARHLIKRERDLDNVVGIRFHQPPEDIDTPEDYARWLKKTVPDQ
jgi:molybdenum cofactor cytidylyltransferase